MALSAKALKTKVEYPKLKLFLYGEWKVGKTTAALQFPKPYFIDTENGAAHKGYQELIEASGGDRTVLTTYDEIMSDVSELATTEHRYLTLVIDSMTTVYSDLLDQSANKLITKVDESGTAFSRHKALPDRKMKRLFEWLKKLDMNVIVTGRSKTKWEKSGSEIKEASTTYDCFASSPYEFDLILEIVKQGNQRIAIVKGSRIKTFEENERFQFSYAAIKERYDNCYGEGALEKTPQAIKMATLEQTAEMERLFSLMKEGDELKEKIMSKAKIDKLEQMTLEQATQTVTYLLNLLTKTEVKQ